MTTTDGPAPAEDATSPLGLRLTEEGEGVTTLELFFDLVYVFAFTQVTALMVHGTAPTSLLQGFIVFALLWWSWCSYAWLANHATATRGVLRLAMLAATATMFVACLAIPEAFHDLPGGVSGPAALVACYALVRLLHLTVYLVAAGPDRGLRRQVLVSLGSSAAPTVVLLAIGVALGEPWQLWVWLAAVVYDLVIIFVTSRGGGSWVVRSAAHFAERHGLVVILALGESMVAIAVGVAQEPLSWSIIGASVLSLTVVGSLWSTYFQGTDHLLEQGLSSRTGKERARLGRDLFTYLHFPIVFGVILAALGIEQAMAHLDDRHLGATGALALGSGLALFLIGTYAAAWRALDVRLHLRLGAAALLLVLAAVGGPLHPLLALALAAVVLLVMGRVEPGRGVSRAPELSPR